MDALAVATMNAAAGPGPRCCPRLHGQHAEIVAGVAAKFNSDEFWRWSAVDIDPFRPALGHDAIAH